MPWFGIASYAFASLVYGAAAIILLVSGRKMSILAVAAAMSSVWSGGIALVLTHDAPAVITVVALDAAHLFVWTLCVLSWMSPPPAKRLLTVLSAAAAVWIVAGRLPFWPFEALDWSPYPTIVVMALLGFLAVEQVFRNARIEQQKYLQLLCIAAGGIFMIDLFVYSQAVLLDGFAPVFWEARGLANVAFLPLFVLGVKRKSEWTTELFVSRQVVFYTASLMGVGGYLLTMGLVAYVIRTVGGGWSFLLEIAFLFGALAVLIAVLFSTKIRARCKVFLVKHFYRNKYDYREEWLHLTQNLGRTGDLPVVSANALEGLARILGSEQGELWLERDPGRYERVRSLEPEQSAGPVYDNSHPIISFLTSTGWVIDSDEYAREPDRYGTSFGDPADGLLPPSSVIVPLDRQGHLQGFVSLRKPATLRSLNFEDHDILKTGGRQVAVVLAQALAQERLAETRQFEAMSRLAAFLMHDLKNVVAQQELVVANAQRFRHRPEFIDDAMSTIRSSVERMKKVMEQLGNATQLERTAGRVDVSKILMEVRSHCADRQPIPEIEFNGRATWAQMDRDQLANVLMHLVRNAQDATPPSGSIKVILTTDDGQLVITIVDSGSGMDSVFIRDRLFRPFDSTKGAKGMGIGVYQVRHVIRSAGGDVDVVSEPGVGTTFRVRLPAAG